MDVLAQTLALVEVGIDFSDEDVWFLSEQQLSQRIEQAEAQLQRLLVESGRFGKLAHEPQVVLTGRPNAGKSTLLNALAGWQRAIVSPIPGTTRDLLSAQVVLARGMVHVIDAAGVEDQASSVRHGIEEQMRQRALGAVEAGDIVLLLCDVTDAREALKLSRRPDLVVWTKTDLVGDRHEGGVGVSAVTGAGMDELRKQLDEMCFARPSGTELALIERHLQAIGEAQDALAWARQGLSAGAEIVALALREALDALGTILGQVTPDDLLSRIFSQFCIGK